MSVQTNKVPAVRSQNSNKLKQFYLYGGLGVAAVLVFVAGWGFGSGRITLSGVRTFSTTAPDYREVTEVYNLLKSKFDGKLTEEQLVNGMMSGMAQATGDPHTSFFTPSEAKEFNQQIDGTISGIGAQLGKTDNGYIQIIAPISGSPAEKSGLRSKDIVAAVNGDSTSGWTIEKAVSKIRGDKGTTVKLTIVRGEGDPFDVTVTRDEITVPSVESSILDGNIGYMKINQFSENTGELADEAAQKFKDANVKAVVLDLRDNPGGIVSGAVDVASLWLPKNKLILQEKRGNTVIKSEYATGNDVLAGVPTTVLINGGSASASEIVAGSLKDNGVATLLGEKSYGKGSVQEPVALGSGSLLKVTIAKWYRPNGKNIDKVGITPDTIVTMTADDYTAGRDPQKDAVLQKLNQ